MSKLFSHRLFIFGAAIFFLPKIIAILLQTYVMEQPRLGDDALLLMWRGEQINIMGISDSMRPVGENAPQALRDIVEFCPPVETYDLTSNQNWCERTAVRFARPHFVMGANFLAAGLMKVGLDLKWTFMAYEAVILTLAALGFAYMLFRAIGPPAAGIGLALLAFVNVPSAQGLHQFIPSVLVMGLSMGLWGSLLGCRSWKGTLPAILGFPLLVWFHPIAILFAGGGVLVFLAANREAWTPKGLSKIALVGGGILAAVLVASDSVRGVISTELTQDLIGNIQRNLNAAPYFLTQFFLDNPGLTALFILTAILWKRCMSREATVIGGVLLLLMAMSLLHITSSYRYTFTLDLFARFYVCFLVIASGVSGSLILSFADGDGKWRKSIVTFLTLSILAAGVPAWVISGTTNANNRLSAVNIHGIAKGLERLPPNSTIAYGEIDVTLPAVMLAGGYSMGVIPTLGLEPARLTTALKERQPNAVAVPLFRRLNTIAASKIQSLDNRGYGINGKYHDKAIIQTRGLTMYSLAVKVVNETDTEQTIGPNAFSTLNGQGNSKNHIIPAKTEKWVKLNIPFSLDVRQIVLTLPDASVWIKGVLVNEEPNSLVDWPWSSGSIVGWHVRGGAPKAGQMLLFTADFLLKAWRVPSALAGVVHKGNPVLSDQGGIVLMATQYGSSE
jgi:hypothetical protein